MTEIPEVQRAYLDELSELLQELLGGDLIGVYAHGSLALGGWHPKTSDIDVLAICAGPISSDTKARIASRLLDLVPPATGLEFSLLTRRAAKEPARKVPFELHVGRGATVEVTDGIKLDGDEDLVLANEICRRAGIAVHGPPPKETFAPIPEAWLLDMCDRELVWILEHPRRTPAESAVLQACRAWRYAQEQVLSSKVQSGRWALEHADAERDLIEAALARKLGDEAVEVDHQRALVLVVKVRQLIQRPR